MRGSSKMWNQPRNLFFLAIVAACVASALCNSPTRSPERDPCAIVRCGYGAKCVVKNGKANCVCSSACPKNLAPVCASDGKTYSNPCTLNYATCESKGKIQKVSDGRCGEKPSASSRCDFVCLAVYQPVCGSDNKTYGNECELNREAACKGIELKKKGDGECGGRKCYDLCPQNYEPVCGTDGVTYSNLCYLNKASCESRRIIEKKSDGECPKPCQRFCPLVFLPVCGSDGKTYGNDCELRREAVCSERPDLVKVRDGKCEKECSNVCIAIYEPVCGSNGVTYSNSCFLDIAACKNDSSIKKVSDGECPSDQTTTTMNPRCLAD